MINASIRIPNQLQLDLEKIDLRLIHIAGSQHDNSLFLTGSISEILFRL